MLRLESVLNLLWPWRRRPAVLEAIYLAPRAGEPVASVAGAELGAAGLAGDRYAVGGGHWQGPDACPVTLVRAEDLERLRGQTGIAVMAGEHRRNLVIRGLPRKALTAGNLHIGQACLEVSGPRPPCGYLERLTQPGMARALRGRSGACARVIGTGAIGVGDPVRWADPGAGTRRGQAGTK